MMIFYEERITFCQRYFHTNFVPLKAVMVHGKNNHYRSHLGLQIKIRLTSLT